MPTLSNNLLCTRSREKFLAAMGLNTQESLFHFSFSNTEQAEKFAHQLNSAINAGREHKEVKSVSLAMIIDSEIQQSTSHEMAKLDINRQLCTAVLEVIKSQKAHFTFFQETGLLVVDLPNPTCSTVLNLLNYPNINISLDGRLEIDMEKYFAGITETVIQISGFDSTQPPILFLNSRGLNEQQMHYITKKLADGRFEVTPYFFVPSAVTPPSYCFALDISGSMEDKLADLKRGVNRLASQLFSFQPHARITIATFSKGIDETESESIHKIGVYRSQHLQQLTDDINKLTIKLNTPLYEVTEKLLNLMLTDPNYNNVLLFSDGEDSYSSTSTMSSIDSIQQIISGLSESDRARNKFYIFSYGTDQSNLMRTVADAFHSEVINTSNPDFVAGLQYSELLKKWAAARELFSIRIEITDQNGAQSTQHYQKLLDMSGQLVNLETRVCQPGEKMAISVSDSVGNELFQETYALLPEKKSWREELIEELQAEEDSLMPPPSEDLWLDSFRKYWFASDETLHPSFILECADFCIELSKKDITDILRSDDKLATMHSWIKSKQIFFPQLIESDISCVLQSTIGLKLT